MTPNIDQTGRVVRAISGIICILAAVSVWILGWPEAVTWRWIVTVVLAAIGLFQFYEAKRGWCAARACGIRTPV